MKQAFSKASDWLRSKLCCCCCCPDYEEVDDHAAVWQGYSLGPIFTERKPLPDSQSEYLRIANEPWDEVNHHSNSKSYPGSLPDMVSYGRDEDLRQSHHQNGSHSAVEGQRNGTNTAHLSNVPVVTGRQRDAITDQTAIGNNSTIPAKQ